MTQLLTLAVTAHRQQGFARGHTAHPCQSKERPQVSLSLLGVTCGCVSKWAQTQAGNGEFQSCPRPTAEGPKPFSGAQREESAEVWQPWPGSTLQWDLL